MRYERDVRVCYEEKAALLRAQDALLEAAEKEQRTLTPDEKTQLDQNDAKLVKLEVDISRKNHELRAEHLLPTIHDLDPTAEERAAMIEAGLLAPETRSLRPAVGGRTYAQMFGGMQSSDGWGSFEDYLTAVHSGRHHPQLKLAAMTGGTPGQGGFLVPEQFAARILDAALEDEIVRPRADVEPMTSDTKKIAGWDAQDNSAGALFGGFTGEWLDESGTATNQDAKVRLIELTARKLGIFTTASNELIADGARFEDMLGRAMMRATAWHLDHACLQGTGAGQPLGVLNDPALITVGTEVGQPASTVVYENLTKMFARLHPGSVSNSVWVVNSTTIPQLLALTIAVGTGGSVVPVMTESNGQFRILTRPVLFTEKLPALGAKGDIMLADFSQYTIGLRREVALEKSVHIGWQTDTSGYRVILRADGQGRWSKPFTPKNGDTLSWCVTLAARA